MRNKFLAKVLFWLLVGVVLIWWSARPVHALDTCEGYRLAITMNCASDAILAHCRDKSPMVEGVCIDNARRSRMKSDATAALGARSPNPPEEPTHPRSVDLNPRPPDVVSAISSSEDAETAEVESDGAGGDDGDGGGTQRKKLNQTEPATSCWGEKGWDGHVGPLGCLPIPPGQFACGTLPRAF